MLDCLDHVGRWDILKRLHLPAVSLLPSASAQHQSENEPNNGCGVPSPAQLDYALFAVLVAAPGEPAWPTDADGGQMVQVHG